MAKKKCPDAPPPGAPLYMTTYGDMVTNVMTFFVLLLSFSSVSQEAKLGKTIASFKGALGVLPYEQTVISPEIVPIPALSNLQEAEIAQSLVEYQEAATEQQVSGIIKLEKTEEGIKITIPDTIIFDSGRARLKDPVLPVLSAIAKLAQGWPNSVIIEGHTDTDPLAPTAEFRDNFELSSARALEVLRYFSYHGIDSKNMIPVGRGEYEPIDTNDTPQGKARNRRVEIYIQYRKETELPSKIKEYLDILQKEKKE
jgi:chemotaxis protein MotB